MKKATIAAQALHLQHIPNIGPVMVKDFDLLASGNVSIWSGKVLTLYMNSFAS